jgi:hypothetical protein
MGHPLTRLHFLLMLLALAIAPPAPGQLHAPPVSPAEVARTGMTNVGEVLEIAPFGSSYKAGAGFAYFGAAGPVNPSILSKVDIRGPLPKIVQDGQPNPFKRG